MTESFWPTSGRTGETGSSTLLQRFCIEEISQLWSKQFHAPSEQRGPLLLQLLGCPKGAQQLAATVTTVGR